MAHHRRTIAHRRRTIAASHRTSLLPPPARAPAERRYYAAIETMHKLLAGEEKKMASLDDSLGIRDATRAREIKALNTCAASPLAPPRSRRHTLAGSVQRPAVCSAQQCAAVVVRSTSPRAHRCSRG